MFDAIAVVLGGCVILGLSLLVLQQRNRLGEWASKYATPSLDAPAYSSIWKVVGSVGAVIGVAWMVVGLARL